jgi:hypothetical protein
MLLRDTPTPKELKMTDQPDADAATQPFAALGHILLDIGRHDPTLALLRAIPPTDLVASYADHILGTTDSWLRGNAEPLIAAIAETKRSLCQSFLRNDPHHWLLEPLSDMSPDNLRARAQAFEVAQRLIAGRRAGLGTGDAIDQLVNEHPAISRATGYGVSHPGYNSLFTTGLDQLFKHGNAVPLRTVFDRFAKTPTLTVADKRYIPHLREGVAALVPFILLNRSIPSAKPDDT